ncbi:MAG TPA: FAD-binding protein [Trebonia sp.]|nr:FAD-binding protein [Trebonia sp.]
MGSGAAGISAALTAAGPGLRVLMVTKDLIGGATPLAQGGLAAAIGPRDSAASHVSDTLTAGAGLCEPDVVASLAAAAPGVIDWLAAVGARLDTRELRLEGGHSHHRIVHSGDDASGAEVHRALLAALLASGVEILDRTVALDLILEDPTAGETVARDTVAGDRAAGLTAGVIGTGGTVAGGRIAGLTAGMIGTGGTVAGGRVAGLTAGMIGAGGRLSAGIIDAPAVVIAAGGLGQAFATTSNPAGATGDGIAIAARAGAAIRDLEFVQFHPTVLWLPGASGQCPLITEALRGAGAVLRDLDGAPLMAGHHPRGDLAPRDVVAARIAEVIAAGTAGHVWLDATALDPDVLEKGFPTVTRACRKHSIDPVTEYIPVAPGAHYSCGGILADLDGRTTISGLYAVGEAASTGVQGANRLASNSVTEAVMAGRRAGQTLGIAVAGSGTGTRSGSLARSATPSTPIGAVDGAGDRTEARVGDGWQAGAVGDEAKAKARAAGGWRRGAGDGGSETERGGSGTEHGANGTEGNGSGNERENGRRGLSVAMSRWAGVLRDREGLSELSRVIFAMGGEVNGVWAAEGGAGRGVGVVATEEDEETGAGPEAHRTVRDEGFGFDVDLEVVEESNLRMVSGLIAAGALRRAESRGCHRRRDATGTAERPWHTVLRWDGQELVVSEEEL